MHPAGAFPSGPRREGDPVSSVRSAAGTTGRQKLVLVLFGLSLAAVGLIGLEAALRLLRVGDDLLFADPFVGFAAGRDLFEKRRLASGDEVYATTEEKLAYFNQQEFPVAKSRDTFRIFTLGGSTTAGRPYDDRVAFSTFLQRYLTGMDPSRRWEVINAGAISYASYRVVLLMKELVRYEPDLFVVYTGHNEFLEERAYPPLIHRNLAAKRLWIWLNGLRTYNLGRRMVQSLRPAGDQGSRVEMAAEVDAKPDDWTGIDRYHRDDELGRAIVEHFEYNLHQMLSLARAGGAGVVFVVPASNLRDFSPFKSEHGPGVTPSDRARVNQLLADAAGLSASDDNEGALEILGEAERLSPLFADVHFRKGKALLELGRSQEARAAFVEAKDLDVVPLRALEEIADLVARTGRASKVPTIDLPATLAAECRRQFGHAIPGNEHFLDHVHPDIPVHSLIAEKIIDALVANRTVRPSASWSELERRRIYDAVVSSLDRERYAERDLNLAKVLGWAGKIAEAEAPLRRAAEILVDHPEVHLNLGIVLQKQKRHAEALEALERSLELDPSSAKTYLNLGIVYGSMDRTDEGIEALETALELLPGYPEALLNLSVLERRTNPEAALGTLQSALAAKPDGPEIHLQMGVVERQLERYDEARGSFERALELDPRSAAARAGLGGVLVDLGELESAERFLREALEIDPNRARASFDLGRTLARSQRLEEAIALYEQAVEIDPGLAVALNNLGIALAGQGRVQEGVEYLQRAVASDSDFAEAHFNLGVACDQLGRRNEALAAVERALELEAENGRFHLAFGMLLAADGQSERAVSHFQEAKRLGEPLPPQISALMAPAQ